MRSCIIIPSRMASTRFYGKPLALLNSHDGAKTMIQRVWEAARKVKPPEDIYIATDHNDIAQLAQAFGANVILTDDTCQNGTERCAQAAENLSDYDFFINLQGDSPLTPPDFLEAIIEHGHIHDITTPIIRLNDESLALLAEDQAYGRIGGTSCVIDNSGKALYFSKSLIPYQNLSHAKESYHFHHVGIYSYKKNALDLYRKFPQSPLERIEGLEQLRFLENGITIQTVEVQANGRQFWEVNNPEDIERVENILQQEHEK